MGSPAEKVGTSGFGDLHETTIKANESAHVLKERDEVNLTPQHRHRTPTGTPACKRMAPASARVAFSSADEIMRAENAGSSSAKGIWLAQS
jgi:hypothetical protein